VQRLDEQLEKGSGPLHTQMKKQQTLCDAKKKQKQKQKNKGEGGKEGRKLGSYEERK
jgi:hypothetical protein